MQKTINIVMPAPFSATLTATNSSFTYSSLSASGLIPNIYVGGVSSRLNFQFSVARHGTTSLSAISATSLNLRSLNDSTNIDVGTLLASYWAGSGASSNSWFTVGFDRTLPNTVFTVQLSSTGASTGTAIVSSANNTFDLNVTGIPVSATGLNFVSVGRQASLRALGYI